MADDLKNSIAVAGSGLQAQSARIKIVAQNIANSDATATSPGEDPYRRKTISFKNVLDKEIGAEKVVVSKIGVSKGEFEKIYDPAHPAADKDGYVKKANVNRNVEMMDLREAQRTYEANLSVIEVTKAMLTRTLDIMR